MSYQEYKQDRRWSDQFIPQIKQIVGPYLLEESSFEVDTQQAADLVVITAKNVTIACRVRRPGYLFSYPNDFTIRSHRDGSKTELRKIISGWGDWMFYGHANNENIIIKWWLLNLNSFREQYADHIYLKGKNSKSYLRVKAKDNGDGTGFHAFDITSFGDGLIIGSGEDSRAIDELRSQRSNNTDQFSFFR